MIGEPAKFVDARGLKCPLPVLRLRREAEGRSGPITLLTDDPAAEHDVPAYVAERGWAVMARTVEPLATRWEIAT